MYGGDSDPSSEEEELVNDQVTRIAGQIIEEMLSNIFSNSDNSKSKCHEGFSDNFIDVYKFPDLTDNTDSVDDEEEVEDLSSEEHEPRDLERNFTDIFKSHDEPFSSEESENYSSDSDSGRGRVYQVNEATTDSEEELFYSSEDLILKFVENEEGNGNGTIPTEENNKEEQSENLVSLEIQDKFQLQVEKHVLKFELSKQLFEGREDSPRQEEDSPDILKERKRKMNEALFASLFDYELQQVENIKLGQSRLSKTLANANLLKLEKDICVKRRRPFCYEDIFSMRRSSNILSRSQSQPNFESIPEDELTSSRSPQPSLVRPILKKTVVVRNSSGSQTDITAVSSRSESDLPGRSSSVTFLLPDKR